MFTGIKAPPASVRRQIIPLFTKQPPVTVTFGSTKNTAAQTETSALQAKLKAQELLSRIEGWKRALSNIKCPDDLNDSEKMKALHKFLSTVFTNFGDTEDWKHKETEWSLTDLPSGAERTKYSRLCHSLRNKATYILGTLMLIEYDSWDPAQCPKVKILEALDNMKKLILESTTKKASESSQPTAHQTLAEILKEFKSSSDRLVHELPHTQSSAVTTQLSNDDLQELFRNLIQNAFTHGDPKQKISYHCSTLNIDKKPYLHFWLKNSGSGITKEDLDTIFKEGGKGSNNQCASSTGKGLFFIREIINGCNGYLSLISQSNQGLLNVLYHGSQQTQLNYTPQEDNISKASSFTRFSVLIPLKDTLVRQAHQPPSSLN